MQPDDDRSSQERESARNSVSDRLEELRRRSEGAVGEIQEKARAAQGICAEISSLKESAAAAVVAAEGARDQTLSTLGAAGTAAAEATSKIQSAGAAVDKAGLEAQSRIAQLLGQAEGAAQGVAEAKSRTDTIAATVDELKRTAQAATDEITRLKADGTAAAAAATSQQTAATAEAAAVKATKATADATLVELKELRTRAEKELASAQSASTTAAELAKVSSEIELRVGDYEKRLAKIIETATEEHEHLRLRIESLLPGATSAGLAAAFEARKNAVIRAEKLWGVLFFLSLSGLLGLTIWLGSGLIGSAPVASGATVPAQTDWHLLALTFLRRVIVVAPVLWLAIFSAKQLKTLLRLEEEYAHKVVISNCFEGYKREVAGITESQGPLARLTEAVIVSLRRSPVRLYDARQSSDSPFEALGDLGASGIDAVVKLADSLAKVKKP